MTHRFHAIVNYTIRIKCIKCHQGIERRQLKFTVDVSITPSNIKQDKTPKVILVETKEDY
jgi:hypothetical protein